MLPEMFQINDANSTAAAPNIRSKRIRLYGALVKDFADPESSRHSEGGVLVGLPSCILSVTSRFWVWPMAACHEGRVEVA